MERIEGEAFGRRSHALHLNSESIMKHVSIVLAALLTPLLIGAGTAAADSWKDESGKGFDKRRSVSMDAVSANDAAPGRSHGAISLQSVDAGCGIAEFRQGNSHRRTVAKFPQATEFR
jgi:hypothetical protein